MSLFQTISNSMPNQPTTNNSNKQSMMQTIMQSDNPQQLAMQMLKQADPEKFKMVQAMMNQGLNPQQVMNQLGINPQQIQILQGMMGGRR